MAKKRANGEGNIYKRDNGSWEARYTVNGKRHSIYGKTQTEVRKKLTEALSQIDREEYIEDSGMTVSQWLTIWQRDYLGNVKQGTADNYELQVRLYINPTLGEIKLSGLKPPAIQKLYNNLIAGGLSPKSVKNTHGCLHKALDIAVRVGCIAKNPTEACILPRITQKEITPLDTPDLTKLMKYLEGHEHEALFKTALFTGMRSGELLGLTWDCVDFEVGVIHVKKQLLQPRKKGGAFKFGTLKNDKPRTIAPAPFIMEVLKKHKKFQEQQRMDAGDVWNDGGFPDLVFTHADGSHLSQPTVWKILQKVLTGAGIEHHRFHDLRHTFAVSSLRAGDDVKTLQENMGHFTAAFTLDRYAHVTETMKRESANRMQAFIEAL